MPVLIEKILDIDESLNDAARVKLSEFFMHWLSLMETQNDIKTYFTTPEEKKETNKRKQEEHSTKDTIPYTEIERTPTTAPKLNDITKRPIQPITKKENIKQKEEEKKEAPSASYQDIPQFFFPSSTPPPTSPTIKQHQKIQQMYIRKLEQAFKTIGGELTKHQFREHITTKVFQLSLYCSSTLFKRIDSKNKKSVSLTQVKAYFINTMCKGMEYIGDTALIKLFYFNVFRQPTKAFVVPEDLSTFLSDLLLYHPGLDFLKETPPFQEKYRQCVIARIFYAVGKFVSPSQDKLTQNQFIRSNLVDRITFITDNPDINLELHYFSYEHFYVLYCKFWALDADHDFLISRADLSSYSNYALTPKILDRVFAGYGRRRRRPHMMSFDEFVWFMLAEEDKTTSSAIEYWFRCLDTDEDGVLSMYEMENFYEEQVERIQRQIQRQGGEGEHITFDNAYRQFCDIVNPKNPMAIKLSDLKRKSSVAYFLFDMLFNLNKMLDFDGKHPPNQQGSKWSQFARYEYDYMAAKDDEEQETNDQYAISYNGY